MKKLLRITLLIAVSIFVSGIALAQGFNYQAIVRGSDGTPLIDKDISIRISLSGENSTPQYYEEVHSVTTNQFGLVNLVIGDGTTKGNFDDIPWSGGNVWMKVELNTEDGSGFIQMGEPIKLMPVPYALYALDGNEGPQGDAGVGIASTTDNGNGTFTINYTDGSSFTTADLTGPSGMQVDGSNGQTLRHDGSTWVSSSNLFNNGTNVGIGTTTPAEKLDVNGNLQLRGQLVDANANAGTPGQYLERGTAGIQWQNSNWTEGTGTTGEMAVWSDAKTLKGVSSLTYSDSSLIVSGGSTDDPNAAIFEVRNRQGEVVFAVYNDGVRVYVSENATKGPRSGFAVGGRAGHKDDSNPLLVVTPDSTRVYITQSAKGPRSGFAVGGRSGQKGAANDLLVVTSDSTRVYVDQTAKGPRSGFAVGGRSGQKGEASDMLVVTPSSTSVYVDQTVKGPRSGFAVGGRSGQKGVANDLLVVTSDSTRVYVDQTAKGPRSGFAVGGRSGQKGAANDLLVVTSDSTRVYVDPSSKGPRSGFAVGGRSGQKGEANDMLVVTPSSTSVYVDQTAKGPRSGFAVGGRSGQKGAANDLLVVTSDSTRVYVDQTAKGPRSGFAVGGRSGQKDDVTNDYFNINTASNAEVVMNENRILWYPIKNAFMTGNIWVGSSDSVGLNSFASGYMSKSVGDYSQALGYKSIAIGNYSTAIGKEAQSKGNSSFAFGTHSLAYGRSSVAIGDNAKSIGPSSFSFGQGAAAYGDQSMAMGFNTLSSAQYATALGYATIAEEYASTSLGFESQSTGQFSFAGGYRSITSGHAAIALGYSDTASGHYSIAMGLGSHAKESWSIAMGFRSIANGQYSLAMGCESKTDGLVAIALGYRTVARQSADVALGHVAKATGGSSTAIGMGASASEYGAFAIGFEAQSTGSYSYAIGSRSKSLGVGSTAIGRGAIAIGSGSTAIGSAKQVGMDLDLGTKSFGNYSVAIGTGLKAQSYGEVVVGTFNDTIENYGSANWSTWGRAFVVGVGENDSNRRSAFIVMKDGDVFIGNEGDSNSDLTVNGSIITQKILSYQTVNSGYNFAVNGISNGIGATQNVGVRGEANGATTNYGIYGMASGGTTQYAGYFDGNVYTSGFLTQSSDARFKENVKTIESPLQKVLNMRGVSYTWKSPESVEKIASKVSTVSDDNKEEKTKTYNFPEGPQIGVIAQEIEKVIPELVRTDADGFKSVDYTKITPVLVEAIKEQQKIIENQQKQLDELKAQLEQLIKTLSKE